MRNPQRTQGVRSVFRAIALIAVGVGLGLGGPAHGQSVFWNPPGGGPGTWDVTTVNWGTTQATPDYVWTNNGNEVANFGVAGGTVALGAPIIVSGINFTTAGYAINGTAVNTLTLSGPGGIVDTGGNDATFGAILGAASVGFTKAGAGTLTITASSNLPNFPYAVTGGILSIDSSLRVNGTGDFTLNGGTLRQTNPGNAGSFIPAARNLVIGSNGGTVDYTSSGTGAVSIYSGTILGTGTLTKTGPQEFRYQGAGLPNTTYTRLVVNQGLFRLGFAAATEDERGFGAVPAAPLSDAITLNGGSIATSFLAANSVLHPNRGVTLGASGGTIVGTLGIPGVVTGGGALIKDNAGTLTLGGAGSVSQNTNTGPTNITAGIVSVQSVDKMSPASAVVMGTAAAATLNLNGNNQTIGSLAGGASATNGNVNLGAATLTAGGDNSSTTYGGVISGTGGFLTKSGSGVMTLTNANTYTGGTIVSSGTLLVNNTTGSGTGTGPVAVDPGATLGGTGILTGDLIVNGNLAPGTSPGILTVGTLTFSGTGLHTAEIQGTVAGTGYDQVSVTGGGGVNLGSSTLNLLFSGYTPSTTDVFTIVNNAGGGPLTSTYGNFPTDGQIVAANVLGSGIDYRIFYGTFAGLPGSVVISPVPEPTHILLIGAAGAGAVRWYRRRKLAKAVS